ncbi:PilZ domain-containing protein [Bacillus sp. REN10]|uniref:flagellar brake protein n=1 Tax=Bacillus sp. REN10 TaxID=2782541 RepID=UPI00193B3767|nr:PilZ domain-containing protein [Bacillus sp. REN10]
MLKVGIDLMLEPLDVSDEEEKEAYRCKVADIKDGQVFINYPVNIKSNRTVLLMDNTELTAEFIDPTAASAVYVFSTKVIGRVKHSIPLLVLQDPGLEKYQRIQRRKYVRVSTAADVAVHLEAQAPFTAVTIDLSAGGLAIPVPSGMDIKQGDQGKVFLSIPFESGDHHYFELTAKVVRVYEEEKSNRTIASLQLNDMSRVEQQLLMRFCFERQIILKRKGLV